MREEADMKNFACFTCMFEDADGGSISATRECGRCGAPLCEEHRRNCAFCRDVTDEELMDPFRMAVRMGWIEEVE